MKGSSLWLSTLRYIASSKALWVFGVARLISSASTRLAKIGPGSKRNTRRPLSSSLIKVVPTISAGIRSGVNWMRLKRQSMTSASDRTRVVFAKPGTPSSNALPPAIRVMTTCRIKAR
jgi:hypothetical protein